jgi:hypothetical protein
MDFGTILGSALKSGWKTSEFWLSLAGLIGVPTILAHTDTIVQTGATTLQAHGAVGAMAASVIVGAYSLGRSWVKAKVGQAAASPVIPVADSTVISK